MSLPECHLRTCTRILAAALLLTMPFPARAVLGDSAASVLTDQARMKGTLRSVDRGTYVMHEITTTTGAVREFVSPGGAVFGVAWEGQFCPIFSSSWARTMRKRTRPRRSSRAQDVRRLSSPRLAWCSSKPAIREVFMGLRTSRSYCPKAYKPAIFAKEGPHEKNWPAARGIQCAVAGGLRFQRQRRWRIIVDHVGDRHLLTFNHPLRPNQPVLGNGDGNGKLQFERDVGGERRHDLGLGLVYRTIGRSYVASGHDYGNLDPGHQQSGDGHGHGESGAADEQRAAHRS